MYDYMNLLYNVYFLQCYIMIESFIIDINCIDYETHS